MMAYLKRYEDYVKKNPKTYVLYCVLRFLVILTLGYHLFMQNYKYVATCLLVLILMLLPSIVGVHLHIVIPALFLSVVYLFIFLAEILGDVNNLYSIIPSWDVILHTISGFFITAFGLSIIYVAHHGEVDLSPMYMVVMSLCVSLAIGAAWEFFEVSGDLLMGNDSQKDTIVTTIHSDMLDGVSLGEVETITDIDYTIIVMEEGETMVIEDGYLDIGLYDTMEDMMCALIGSLVFVVWGYLDIKCNGISRNIHAKGMVNKLIFRSESFVEA